MVADQLGAGGDACAGSPPHAVLTGMVAMVIGTATSYALIHFFIGADFTFNLPLIALTAFSGAAFTICLGLAGAMRTLGSKPAPFLRETI